MLIALSAFSILAGVVELPPDVLVDYRHSGIYRVSEAILCHVLVFGEIIYTSGDLRDNANTGTFSAHFEIALRAIGMVLGYYEG